MSVSFRFAVLAALVAAGLFAAPVQAQYSQRLGSPADKPNVRWSAKPVAPAPGQLPLQAPNLPNNWQPALRPPVFGQSSSQPPKGANSGYRHTPAYRPQPAAAKKPAPARPLPATVQLPSAPRGGKPQVQPKLTPQVIQAVQPPKLKTNVVQTVQPPKPKGYVVQTVQPPKKAIGSQVKLDIGKPHGPRNPNSTTVRPRGHENLHNSGRPNGSANSSTTTTSGAKGTHSTLAEIIRNLPPHGSKPPHGPNRPHPETPRPPTPPAVPHFNFGPPVAPPIYPSPKQPLVKPGPVVVYVPTPRPRYVQPVYPQSPRPADPSPQPSRPTAATAASAEEPRIRVRVRSGSGKPVASAVQPGGGPPRRTISLSDVTVSGGLDDGPIARSHARLTAAESAVVAEAADRFGEANPSLMSADQDELISAGLDAIASGEALTEEQRDTLLDLADTSVGNDVWDRLEDLGLDASEVRGAIYSGLQEDRERAAVAAGRPAGSVPTLSAEANADLAFFRDMVFTVNGSANDRLAGEGINSILRGEPMSAEQREAVRTSIDEIPADRFAWTDANGATSNGRGSLAQALQADADAQAALAEAGGAGGAGGNDVNAIRDLVTDILTTIGFGAGGGGGMVMPVPAWPVGGGMGADPGFVDVGISGGAVAPAGFVDPNVAAAPAPAATASAPGLEASGTTAVEPSAPAGAAPSPQPGPGEAKYDRRYLSVRNDSATRLALFLQYETISSATGEWKWYPNDPTGGEAVSYSLEPGQEVALKRDDWSVNARRVRIWAATEDGQVYDQFRSEDLWLVEEQPNGARYYIGTKTETFPLAFGEQAATE